MTSDVTQAAILALGANHNDDYVVQPEKHAQDLPSEAGALARVLRSDKVSAIIAAYNRADQAAIKQQASYKYLGRWSLWGIFVAALFGGLSLWLLGLEGRMSPLELYEWASGQAAPVVAGSTSSVPLVQRLAISVALYTCLFVQFLSIFISFWASRRIRQQGLFDLWNKERGLAELHRRQLFESVTAADEPSRSGEGPLLPLQLEYFRRFQLDVQSAYYRRRGDQHWEAANGTKGWSGDIWRLANAPGTPLTIFVIAMFILFVADISMSLVGILLTGLSLAGVLGTALSSYFNGLTALNQDRLNAARYFIAAKNLNFLYETRLEPVRHAAAAGDKAAVAKFVDDVNAQISTEHREWYLLHDPDTQPGLNLVRPNL